MKTPPPQQYISAACEEELERHGDNFRGAGYTKSRQEAEEMYDVMLGVIRNQQTPVSLLDFGCGLAHMLDHIEKNARYQNIQYSGLDISQKFLDAAKARHPQANFIRMDVLESAAELPEFDYLVMNGIFNYRGEISGAQMSEYWQRMISVAYKHCRQGIAFNVMSKIVDWERDDLFHLSFDTMTNFVAANLSRHFIIHHDYRGYESTTYVYRNPYPPRDADAEPAG